MTVSFENVASAGGSFASSITVSLNAGTNAHRCVLAVSMADTDSTTQPNSATYGGVAMTAGTLISPSDGGPSRKVRGFWLYGASVPTGANNLVVTYSDGNGKPHVVAAAYSDVDESAGVSGEVTGNNFSSTVDPTWTVTSASGDRVAALMFSMSAAAAYTAQDAAVERLEAAVNSTFLGYVIDEAGASSLAINANITSAGDYWRGFAVSLKDASPAAVASNPIRNLVWMS